MKSLLKLTWVELKLFFREPLTMVFTFALPVVFLLVMGGVFGNKPDSGIYRGVGAVNYYNPAYVALVLASIGIVAMPVHLTAYRERRVLKRFHASSLSVWNVIGSQILVAFVTAILGSILMTVISLFVYHANSPKMWELLIPAFIIRDALFYVIRGSVGSNPTKYPRSAGNRFAVVFCNDDTGWCWTAA
jgi:ABC-2 type transport system permease protein